MPFGSLFISLFCASEQSNFPNINKYFSEVFNVMFVILSQLLIYGNPGPIRTRKTVEGLSQCAEFYLAAVDQSDKEKQ